MPIYEYRCDACDTVFEEWRRHADDVMDEPCPKCGKIAHRMISNTSFVLKGGGWYVTEYGNKKTDSSSGAAKDPAASDAAPAAPVAPAASASAEPKADTAQSPKSAAVPPAPAPAGGATAAAS